MLISHNVPSVAHVRCIVRPSLLPPFSSDPGVLPARRLTLRHPERLPPSTGDALLAHVRDSSIGLVCAYVSPRSATKRLRPALSPVGAWRAWRGHGIRGTSWASELVDCGLYPPMALFESP